MFTLKGRHQTSQLTFHLSFEQLFLTIPLVDFHHSTWVMCHRYGQI